MTSNPTKFSPDFFYDLTNSANVLVGSHLRFRTQDDLLEEMVRLGAFTAIERICSECGVYPATESIYLCSDSYTSEHLYTCRGCKIVFYATTKV